MNEALQKMDEVFESERQCETITAGEAMGLIGSAIRKAAAMASESPEFVKAVMQRSYLMARHVEDSLAKSGDDDSVAVPPFLLESVRKDAERSDQADVYALPISEAMKMAVARFADNQSVGKSAKETSENAPLVWGADLNDESAERVNWGADPDWTKVQ